MQDDHLKIYIGRSKADQIGKGKQLVFGRCCIKGICPVEATQVYLEFRGKAAGYFFEHADKSPLTK